MCHKSELRSSTGIKVFGFVFLVRAEYIWTRNARLSALQAWRYAVAEIKEAKQRKELILQHRAVRMSKR